MGEYTKWSAEKVATFRAHLANGLTDKQIADEMGLTHEAVVSKRTRMGLACNPTQPWRRPMPADFPANHKRPVAELMPMYHCCKHTITRWRKECGYVYRQDTPKKFNTPVAPKPASDVIWKHWGRQPQNTADGTLAGRASDFLKRWFIPVFRVSAINPKADPDLYRVGRKLVTRTELVEMARAKGFTPDEWSKVA